MAGGSLLLRSRQQILKSRRSLFSRDRLRRGASCQAHWGWGEQIWPVRRQPVRRTLSHFYDVIGTCHLKLPRESATEILRLSEKKRKKIVLRGSRSMITDFLLCLIRKCSACEYSHKHSFVKSIHCKRFSQWFGKKKVLHVIVAFSL